MIAIVDSIDPSNLLFGAKMKTKQQWKVLFSIVLCCSRNILRIKIEKPRDLSHIITFTPDIRWYQKFANNFVYYYSNETFRFSPVTTEKVARNGTSVCARL